MKEKKSLRNFKGGGKEVPRSSYYSSKKPKVPENVTFKGKTR